MIDSTTDIEDTPPKKRRLDTQSQKTKQGKPKGAKQSTTLAKAEAAKKKCAAELFAFSSEGIQLRSIVILGVTTTIIGAKEENRTVTRTTSPKICYIMYQGYRPW